MTDGWRRIDGCELILSNNLAACTGGTPEALAANYTQYGALKVDTGEAVVATLAPIQARYHELMADPAELQALLRKGAAKARAVAAATLDRAQRHIGNHLADDRCAQM